MYRVIDRETREPLSMFINGQEVTETPFEAVALAMKESQLEPERYAIIEVEEVFGHA